MSLPAVLCLLQWSFCSNAEAYSPLLLSAYVAVFFHPKKILPQKKKKKKKKNGLSVNSAGDSKEKKNSAASV